ncbi:MAG TPA: endonuclease III domain-containing protein, partial [Candidatus Omnitrophota bacterium]|nr:endonuclease III domain-containing protein [Candidatus Omnitrophota bacterium]
RVYGILLEHFGPQHWWPGDSAFEIIVGAILTQNTNWQNVARAVENLKRASALSAGKLRRMNNSAVARLIRPSGYYRLKTKRLKNFLDVLHSSYGGSLARMRRAPLAALRQQLLSVNGIGPETADSILLYAFNKPVFVVDAYTRRIFSRHGLVPADASYGDIQTYCMRNLAGGSGVFNEFHALIVRLGKEYCLKTKPRCGSCPLKYEK